MKRFSKQLGLYYTETPEGIVFEDGVAYTHGESALIAHAKPSVEDLTDIHMIKSIFDGYIEGVSKVKDDTPQDGLTALGRTLGAAPYYRKRDPELQRRIDNLIRKRKGLVDSSQEKLDL